MVLKKQPADSLTLWHIVSVHSHGDAVRCHCYRDILTMKSSHPSLYSILDKLPLCAVATGEGDISMLFAEKHFITQLCEGIQ